MQLTLRRSGGSLVMTVPKAYIEQNQLHDGSSVDLIVDGDRLIISAPRKPKYTLEELLAQMPEGLPRDEVWDDMAPVGQEII